MASMNTNAWLDHVMAPDKDSPFGSGSANRTENEEYKWKNCEINLTNEQLLGDRNQIVSDPLLHVNINVAGFRIWRVKDGALEHWRREDYGHFYNEDCFILMHIRDVGSNDTQPTRTLHLWAGRSTDEETYRQAVRLTIALNGRLDNKAIVHREPQAKETRVFKNYFPYITYWKGSADDNYWHTVRMRDQYIIRLLKCYRPDPAYDHYRVVEVGCREDQLNTSFVYIMDRGDILYQWNGDVCMTEDVFKISKYIQHLRSSRGLHVKIDTTNYQRTDEEKHPFYMFLTARTYMVTTVGEEDAQKRVAFSSPRRVPGMAARGYMFRISSQGNNVHFKKCKDGIITMKDTVKEKACIMDFGDLCILWFSESVLPQERASGIAVIHEYLRQSGQPLRPAVVISHGQRSPELSDALRK